MVRRRLPSHLVKRAPASVLAAFHGLMNPLPIADLVEWTAIVADEVREGRHAIHADPEERWHVRLFQDDRIDVWLISWTPEQGTQMHDHGGSAGAFTVVTGELSEAVWDPTVGKVVERTVGAGDAVAFGTSYVHDVRNVGVQTAVSVHAYSPPLTSMSFYDVVGGELEPLAQIWTDDPEVAMPDLQAAS